MTDAHLNVLLIFSKRYPSLHCLHVGDASKTIYLPMEVCKIVPGQRCLKRLNEAACQEMIKIASKRPNLRQDTITKIVCILFNIKITKIVCASKLIEHLYTFCMSFEKATDLFLFIS